MGLEFMAQCCDADYYLALGRQCAQAGDCYDTLRPLGAALWFSLPYRLGWPPATLVGLHALLGLMSVLGAMFALRARVSPRLPWGAGQWALALLASASLHGLVFAPVFFHALADTPAGLLALVACWLCLAHRGWPAWLAAGTCLGLATWLRLYYLWPLVGVWGILLAGGLYQRDHRPAVLAFVAASALPVLAQYGATLAQTGEWSFVGRARTEALSGFHTAMPVAGYDTRLSGQPVYWVADCGSREPRAFIERPWREQCCLLGSRLQFYFGSYSPVTYLPEPLPGARDARWWSPVLLLGHAWWWAVALAALWEKRQRPGLGGLAVLLFAGLCLAEGLLVIPEQRFVVVPVVVMVWLGIAATWQWLSATAPAR